MLNNHVTAAVTALVAIYAALAIWYDGRRELRYFAVAGLFAALTAADELPALSFLAALSAGLLWQAPRPTLAAYLPAVLVVAAVSSPPTTWLTAAAAGLHASQRTTSRATIGILPGTLETAE